MIPNLEHACHAAGCHKFIDVLHAAIYLSVGIAGSHDSLKEALGSDVVFASNLYQYFRLEDEGTDTCRKS